MEKSSTAYTHNSMEDNFQIFSFIGLFASSFIWNDTNVYIQLGYKGYGWQTLIIACLLVIWIVNLISLLTQLGGRNLFQEFGKFKVKRFDLIANNGSLLDSGKMSRMATEA